jgi:N-acetylmuramoyl-L-alanine amidase
MTQKTIIVDPGHGMGNKRKGRFDPGAVNNGVQEAQIVMDWANELRGFLLPHAKVIRTRIDHKDPAPIGQRAKIAKEYGGDIMVSFHCNSSGVNASGTETFYRGSANKKQAEEINLIVVEGLGTKNRGAKLEKDSQHKTLAVMSFQPCFLVEIGFLDHKGDKAKMLDPELRKETCRRLAEHLTQPQ